MTRQQSVQGREKEGKLTILTESAFDIITTISLILGAHRSILDKLRLAHGHTLSLSLLVKEEEEGGCEANTGDESAEDTEGGFDTGKVVGLVFVLEEPTWRRTGQRSWDKSRRKRDLQRADDVTSSRTGVVDTHEQRFLGLSTSVGDDPWHDDGVGAIEEGEEVVTDKSRSLLEHSSRILDVKQDKTDDDGDDKWGENGRLDLEFVSGETACKNSEELQETEWHVEQWGDSAVESKALDESRTKDCSNWCAHIQEQCEGQEEVRLDVVKEFPYVGEFKFVGTGTGLVSPQSLNTFRLVFFRKESGRGNVGVNEEVDDRSGQASNTTADDEDELPDLDVGGGDVTKTKREESGDNGGETVGGVPYGDTNGLFRSTVPLGSEKREERKATSFEETKEGSRNH